jgi:DNA-binding CsgD family transcriptional regulator
MDGAGDGSLLDIVYDAAVEPGMWLRLMEQVADRVGGAGAALIRQNQRDRRGQAVTARLDPAVSRTYFSSFAKSHGRREAGNPEARVRRFIPHIVSNEDQYPVLARSELYNEFMRPLDIHAVVRLGLAADGLDASLLAIMRPERAGGFGGPDLALLKHLHPHLIRAYRLGRKFGDVHRLSVSVEQAFEAAADAMILLDETGRVLALNRSAETMIAARDGVAAVGARLTADRPQDSARLEAMIRTAASGDNEQRAGGSIALPRPSGCRPWAVSAAPIRAGRVEQIYGGLMVIVTFTDLDAGGALPGERLRTLFGLTPAEVSVALRIFEGESAREASGSLGSSFNTVRSHLVRVFEKTGTKRQAELMRLMMRIAQDAPRH